MEETCWLNPQLGSHETKPDVALASFRYFHIRSTIMVINVDLGYFIKVYIDGTEFCAIIASVWSKMTLQ